MEKLLWYIIAGTRGGINRARIIYTLKMRPFNANQLAEKLGLDYKTVTHHIKVLQKNNLIVTTGNGYGDMHFLTERLEAHFEEFLDIWHTVDNSDETGDTNL